SDLYKSTDGGSSWQAIARGLPRNYGALAIDPQTTTTVYAGTWGGGIFKSTDGGASWNAVNTGLPAACVYTVAIDPRTPTTLYAGTSSPGLFKSTAGGVSWAAAGAGLPQRDASSPSREVLSVAIDPQTPSTLYAGTSGGGVFKSTDGGGTWGAVN